MLSWQLPQAHANRLGTPKSITAAAHKLARVVYHILTTREPYSDTVFKTSDTQNRERLEARLRRKARQLGFDLLQISASCVP
jgi:hypothetical protein